MMNKYALSILLAVLATPAWATTYYIAPAGSGGNDSNAGTSANTPWLTPGHAVNCGDTIQAAAGSYSATNFSYGKWGAVSCPAGNNVAWLKCITFDACKMSASGSYVAMAVTQSYWGVQGWEVTATADTDACFTAYPSSGTEIHHVIFANNVANGCFNSGFQSGNNGNAGVDYFVVVGNIAYNASQSTVSCVSGIDVYQPVQSDALPGTHIYIAGNFSWGNMDPNPCAGAIPTDGEGIIIDTPDGSQGSLPSPYAQQIVVDNNLLVGNGGRGLEVYNNTAGSAHALIYLRHNTMWGNNLDPNQKSGWCNEVQIAAALNVQAASNLAATSLATGCGGNPVYAYYLAFGDATDIISSDSGYSASGSNDYAVSSPGFSFTAGNLFGTNPKFANATVPGAPSCANATSVPNCMAAMVANFTPTTSAEVPYGYQKPSSTAVNDALFPQWLCNVNLPAGLVTMGCLAQSAVPPTPTITNVIVK